MKDLLTASEAPINKIFCADYTLVVPEYQRPYSWTTDEADTLLDDLLAHLERNGGTYHGDITPYFLGSVVLAKKTAGPMAEIVDGQQRLSTITILLASLRARLESDRPGSAEDIGSLVFESGSVIKNIKSHYRLTMRKRDQDFFQSCIQSPDGLSKLIENQDRIGEESRHLMRENARLYKDRLDRITDIDKIESLATLIATKCYMVVVETKDFNSAYRVFNVLNDRGRDLSDTDILKAELLGRIREEDRGEHADHWDDIEALLGRKELGNLLGHIKSIETKINKQGSRVEEFRERVISRQSRPFEAGDFIKNELQPFSLIYRDLLDSNYGTRSLLDREHVEIVNDSLYWINATNTEDWMPLALLAWSSLKHDPEAMADFFKQLERLLYSFLIRNISLPRRVVRMAKVIMAIEENPYGIEEIMSSVELTPREQNQTLLALDGPVYESIGQRRLNTLLQRLSDLLSSDKMVSKPGLGAKAVSIEHILPQNPEEGSEWTEWIPEATERELWVHRLGNLSLLNQGKNSGAGRKDFNAKKVKYFKEGGVTPFAITAQVAAEGEWGVEQIERRQKHLIDVLSQHWGLKSSTASTPPIVPAGTIKRRPRFSFKNAGIEVGSVIQWNRGPGPTATVLASGRVSFLGEEMDLREATLTLLNEPLGTSIRPIRYWSYEGRELEDIYNEYAGR